MTSPEAPSSLLQASLPGQEVLDFYYLLDPEERLQLGYRAHCLVQHVAKTNPQIIFFLDKSGRPLQYLFRTIWPWCQARGEVRHDQYPDQTGFLHIGKDPHMGEPPWQLLSSEDLPKLAAYYRRMLGAEPERILIVDELLGRGNTMNFAHRVVAKMFPRASLDGFYFQDSTGTIELFRKPVGQAAVWRLMVDDHLAYGLTGVSDINANFRKEFRDILAYRAVLRCDWREQLWAMEYECLLNFAIKRRLVGSHLPALLAEVSEVLEGIPNSTLAKRGIAYARRTAQALENGLPPMPPRREEGIDINNTMEDLRSVTHDDIVSLRVAECYWN